MALNTAERERLDAVRRYDVLDTPPDGAFDRIARLAARLLRVPIAIVSVVDEDRIWFKAHHGVDVSEIPRRPGLCASAIMGNQPYVLPDALLDPVALTNPLVAGEFGLRFYAAVPLTVSDGHNLGTLCVIDKEPRTLSDEEMEILTDLAALVVHELELRLAARIAVSFESELRRSSEELSDALQAAILPPQLPRIPGLELAARYHPAERAQIGGDFYDLFPLPRRGWGIAMGDVCGKGPKAAAITAAVRHALRAAAVNHDHPSDVLSMVNETLLLDEEADGTVRFCTLVYARLRPHGHDFNLTVASGGHPLPLCLRAEGTVEPVGEHGTVVGCLGEATFGDRAVRLRRGDTVVFYTDGVTETSVGADQLGQEGLARLLSGCAGQPASAVVEAVARTVLSAQPHQRDDVAVLALHARRD